MRGSVVERSRELGVLGSAADVTLEGCVVRDTERNPLEPAAPQLLVVGGVQIQSAHGAQGRLTVRSSLLERNHAAGVNVICPVAP